MHQPPLPPPNSMENVRWTWTNMVWTQVSEEGGQIKCSIRWISLWIRIKNLSSASRLNNKKYQTVLRSTCLLTTVSRGSTHCSCIALFTIKHLWQPKIRNFQVWGFTFVSVQEIFWLNTKRSTSNKHGKKWQKYRTQLLKNISECLSVYEY